MGGQLYLLSFGYGIYWSKHNEYSSQGRWLTGTISFRMSGPQAWLPPPPTSLTAQCNSFIG